MTERTGNTKGTIDASVLQGRLGAGFVRQTFSHGRTKSVQVEVKRRRTKSASDADSTVALSPGAEPNLVAPPPPVTHDVAVPELMVTAPPLPNVVVTPEPATTLSAPVAAPSRLEQPENTAPARTARPVGRGVGTRAPSISTSNFKTRDRQDLSNEELERRKAALTNLEETQNQLLMRQAELERQSLQNAAIRSKKQQIERDLAQRDQERRAQDQKRQAEAAARAEVKPIVEVGEPVDRSLKGRTRDTARTATAPHTAAFDDDTPSAGHGKRREREREFSADVGGAGRGAGRGGTDARRQGRLTMAQVLASADGEMRRERSLAALRRQRERERQTSRVQLEQREHVVREVTIPETITVADLANRMAVQGQAVIKALMKMGVMAALTQAIDADTAAIVVSEFGHKIKMVQDSSVETVIDALLREPLGKMVNRGPIVTVMGHVDHGKTSLLDAIRSTEVAAGEAGGITQHIAAWVVDYKHKGVGKMVFVDTPGHAAFTHMRRLGANLTDIVVLVVAADDGVRPQTIEAIGHAKAAKVPIVVAINKIDRPGINLDRIRAELVRHELILEEYGGDIQSVEVSALNRKGIPNLLEAIAAQAEIMELKAAPHATPRGFVLESGITQGIGPTATLVLQHGTIQVGDSFVCGTHHGRVRFLRDDHGKSLRKCGPGLPVLVVGFDGVVSGGDQLVVMRGPNSDAQVKEIAEYRATLQRDQRFAKRRRSSLAQAFDTIQEGEKVVVPIVVRADVQGTLQAIVSEVNGLTHENLSFQLLHQGTGDITESDVGLIGASGGLVVGFNARINAKAREAAKNSGVEIRNYHVIYELFDSLKLLLTQRVAPVMIQVDLGEAEVRQIFEISRVGNIAGCMVLNGKIQRNGRFRVLRRGEVIHEGGIRALRRFKDDVREVQTNFECGIQLDGFNDLVLGDRIVCFEERAQKSS